MKLGVLGIIGLFLLTGCGSSTSSEGQVKLIEYENCLSWERDAWLAVARNQGMTQSTLDWIRSSSYQDGSKIVPDYFLERCEKYRP